MTDVIIYGAYGYTGELIVQEALDQGLRPIVAGRDKVKTEKLAHQYNLKSAVFSLDDKVSLHQNLKDCTVMIHCAGPFVHTAKSMADACIETQTHYIDITGEYVVFEMLNGLTSQAKAAGIMLLPGAGFDVVPSDCLAGHLHKLLPDAEKLEMAFTSVGGGLSRGTAKTMIEKAGDGQLYRKNGNLQTKPLGRAVRTVNYHGFQQLSVGISWGDICTAYYSTGINDIEIFTGTTKRQLNMLRWMGRLKWLLRMPWVKRWMLQRVDKKLYGPSAKKRAKSHMYLWGSVMKGSIRKEGWLKTPNGYTLTAKTTVLITKKILQGNFKAGYQTPAMAYGNNLIMEIGGCEIKIAP